MVCCLPCSLLSSVIFCNYPTTPSVGSSALHWCFLRDCWCIRVVQKNSRHPSVFPGRFDSRKDERNACNRENLKRRHTIFCTEGVELMHWKVPGALPAVIGHAAASSLQRLTCSTLKNQCHLNKAGSARVLVNCYLHAFLLTR